ncbi:MAG: zinc-binding dehydrogenase [Verrucomicrobiota bacterium]|jgi:S-(hydroxymethyl)glutathione dehydrogenase/alcohol dehydrogenase
MKTKAAILVELNAPLVVDEIEIPPLDCGQVLVQIHCSGICGAQIGEIAGVKGPDRFLPHLLGHEGGGVVVDTGPGVSHVKKGDPVVMHWRKGIGIHAAPAQYPWKSRTVNSGWVTTFSQYSVVSENRVTPVGKDIPFEIAALMGCAVTTGLGLINNDAHVKIGQSVAVLGVGGVGLNAVQGAALAGADPILAIDLHDHKLALARKFGATHGINSSQGDFSQEIIRITGPGGVDVFIENTGLTRLIEMAYNLTAPQGRTILVGVPRLDQDITIHSLPLHFGKVLSGCEGGHTYPTSDIPRYLRLYQNGRLQLAGQITHRFPLDDVNHALDTVRGGKAGRCVLMMG